MDPIHVQLWGGLPPPEVIPPNRSFLFLAHGSCTRKN